MKFSFISLIIFLVISVACNKEKDITEANSYPLVGNRVYSAFIDSVSIYKKVEKLSDEYGIIINLNGSLIRKETYGFLRITTSYVKELQ